MFTHIVFRILFGLILSSQGLRALAVDAHPFCEHKTSASLYNGKRLVRLFIGKTKRYSSCGGIAWFDQDRQFATINYQGGCLCRYSYNTAEKTSQLEQVIESDDLLGGELIDVSPDQTLLAAISNYHGLFVYPLDKATINPNGFCAVREGALHGVRFAHTSPYIGYSSIARGKGGVTIMRYDRAQQNSATFAVAVDTLKNVYQPLQPKSLDFSNDDRFLIVAYAHLARGAAHASNDTVVAVYAFDAQQGIITKDPVCVRYLKDTVLAYEDVRLYKDSHIVISDQANHMLIAYAFDQVTGHISEQYDRLLDDSNNRLASPHGIAFFDNNTKLAVTNYGLDSVSLFDVIPQS